jgi:hypothetical protein
MQIRNDVGEFITLLGSAATANKVERELQQARSEIERLTLERDFYSKRVLTLEEENRELTEAATKYSVRAQEVERELTEIATQYSLRAQKLERELTRSIVSRGRSVEPRAWCAAKAIA